MNINTNALPPLSPEGRSMIEGVVARWWEEVEALEAFMAETDETGRQGQILVFLEKPLGFLTQTAPGCFNLLGGFKNALRIRDWELSRETVKELVIENPNLAGLLCQATERHIALHALEELNEAMEPLVYRLRF